MGSSPLNAIHTDAHSQLTETLGDLASSLTHLDQSILAKAFRGELVPQDPNDEPASVLLERIRASREASKEKKSTSRKRKANRK